MSSRDLTLHRPTARAISLLALISIALVRIDTRFARADGDESGAELEVIIEILADTEDDELRLELLAGLREGLAGRKKYRMPKSWPRAYAALSKSPSARVRDAATAIALIFDDPAALESLLATLRNRKLKTRSRLDALGALVDKRAQALPTTLHALLDDPAVRRPAIRALANFDDDATPDRLLALYSSLDGAAQQDTISTLASRPTHASRLLGAVAKGTIPTGHVSAIHARQIEALGDRRLLERLREIWGDIRKTSEDTRAAIAKHKKLLRPAFVAEANLPNGRVLFEKTCAKCHKLYDVGESIGPELTGSNRANLDYILENILDPSAAIGKGYRLTTVVTRDGRAISGIIRERASRRIKIRTESDLVTIAEEDALSVEESNRSMMPDGLLTNLRPEEVRDLIGYLATRKQVPLPGSR